MDGLLGDERRKAGAILAVGQRAILGRGPWQADDLRDIVRGCALEALADAVMTALRQSCARSRPARRILGRAKAESLSKD